MTLAITRTVPTIRGTRIASSQTTSGFSVYAMTMPSNNGTTKGRAHDRAKTSASVASTASAKPRASTGIRVAETVTGCGSTARAGCSTIAGEARESEAGTAAGTGPAAEFMAHRRKAGLVDASRCAG